MLSGSTVILALILVASAIGLSSRKFVEWTVLRPYSIARGSAYPTLLTSGFVHADLMHLLFNLFTFYAFGPLLERTIGTTQFLILYFCGLLISERHHGGFAIRRIVMGFGPDGSVQFAAMAFTASAMMSFGVA